MASFVYYNGILKYVPGGITKVDTSALNVPVAGDNGAVFLIGEADGGAPGVIFKSNTPTDIQEEFLSGPLADAANIAFTPSNDPNIPGGASTIYLYKTNASTQSSAYLPSAPASQSVNSTATAGAGTTLTDTAQSATSVDDQFNGAWIVLRPLTSTTEVRRITDYVASTGVFTVASAWSSNPVAADPYLVLSDTVNLVDKIAAGSTTTVVNVTATMVASAHVNRWAYIHRVGAVPELRKIVSNNTTSITVTPSLPAAPTASAYVEILANAVQVTSKNYGESTNGISVDLATAGLGKSVTVAQNGTQEVATSIGGVPFLNLLFKGAPVVINDTVAASSTVSVINLTTAGLTPSAHVGRQVYIDGEYTVITANTASALTVSPALSAAPDLSSTVTIYDITRAKVRVSGTAGVATGLTTSTGVVGADLSITFPAGQTLRQLVAAINLNTNYVAVIPNGINSDLALSADFDYGPTTEQNILVSSGISVDGLRQDVSQLVNYFNNISAYVSATRATTGVVDGSHMAGDIADPIFLSGAVRGVSTNSTFQAGMDAALTVRANSVVPLIDQDLVNEGYSSTATLASVAAQLRDHVVAARGAVGSERGGFLGVDGTKSQLIDQAANLNDMDIAVVGQSPTLLDTTGTLRVFGPRMLAVMAAGCRAGGTEVGTALTNKVVKVSGLTQDSSWDPNNLTDANDLIKAGVLFAATDDNNVTKWVRDLTTWLTDNNLALSEGSVRDEVRYVAYNLRKGLVDKFTGKKPSPATLQSVKDAAVGLLEQFRSANIIIDTTDPVTGAFLKAYSKLRITATGDVMKLSVCICPAPSVNFQLHDISLIPFSASV